MGTAVFVWHWILGVACCLFAAFVMQQGNSITGTSLLPGLALSYVFQTMFCCRIPRARVSFFGQVMDARRGPARKPGRVDAQARRLAT